MKNRRTPTVVALLGSVMLAGVAQAELLEVTGQGTPISMSSGAMPSLFTPPYDHDFSDAAMAPVHQMLHADGIVTDGKVTFLFLDTADGMSFLTLVDDNTTDVIPGNTELNMTTSGPSSAHYWVNDLGDLDLTAESEGATMVVASFKWNNGRGDGFGWSGLEGGDTVEFSFSPRGEGTALAGDNPYQFVSIGENGWETVRTGDYSEGGFDFEFTVPLPAPGVLALLSVAGIIGAPRRRRV